MVFITRVVPCASYALAKISTHARRNIKKDCFSLPVFVSLSAKGKKCILIRIRALPVR